MPHLAYLNTPTIPQHVGLRAIQGVRDVYVVDVGVEVPVWLKARPVLDTAKLELLASHLPRDVADVHQSIVVEIHLS